MQFRNGTFWRQFCLALALVAGTATTAAAQGGTITGRVTDAGTQQPLANSRVYVLGTTLSAMTNVEGVYALRAVPAGFVDLRVIRVGYTEQKKPVTVQVGESATVNFALSQTATQLETIVTTATGEERRAEVGHTVKTLGDVSQRVEQTPISSMTELLVAKAPGVVVLPGSMTGTAGTIRLRGLNSISLGNAPIWIVDGVRFISGSVNVSTGGQDATLLSSLNPEEIEKMEVVTGPAAATLYGTDAANGIIVVTTKRGTPGATRWQWYTEHGMVKDRGDYPDAYMNWGHTPANPTVQTRCELSTIATGACIRDSVTSFNPMEVSNLTPLQTGYRSQYGGQVSGGTNALKFFVSGEAEREEGPVRLPEVDRLRMAAEGVPIREEWEKPEVLGRVSVRANLNAALNDKFDLGVTSAYINTSQRFVQTDNNLFGIFYQTSMNPGFNGAGPGRTGLDSFGRPLNGNASFVFGDIFQRQVQQDVQRLLGSVNGNWRPLSWLSGDATLGVDLANRRNFLLCRFQQCPNSGTTRLGFVESIHTNDRNLAAKVSGTGIYQPRTWLNLRTTVGMDYIHDGNNYSEAYGEQLPPGSQSTGNAAVMFADNASPNATKTLGLYAQEHASFRDKLFVTLAARSDKNSAFGVNYKNALYPSASVSWIASDEEFFPRVPGLSYLRLRAALGTAGVNPGATTALDTYGSTTVNISGTDTPGLQSDNIGNSQLRPEVSTEFETGFETRLLRDRINVDFTYYTKRTRDALLSVQLAPSSGASDLTVTRNIGSVRNAGVEVSINTTILNHEQFSWDITAAGSRNENKILSLGGLPTIGTGVFRDSVGYPVSGMFQRKFTYNDTNNDGYIVASEITVDPVYRYLGSSVPQTSISLTNGVELLNRSLKIYAMFDFKGDFYVENGTWRFLCVNNPAAEDRSNPNATMEEQARCGALRAGTPVTTTAGYYDKANFVRFRELSARYRLPASAVKLTRAADASISVGARNIALWSNWSGTDPEMNYSVTDEQNAFMSSSPRSVFNFRLNLTY